MCVCGTRISNLQERLANVVVAARSAYSGTAENTVVPILIRVAKFAVLRAVVTDRVDAFDKGAVWVVRLTREGRTAWHGRAVTAFAKRATVLWKSMEDDFECVLVFLLPRKRGPGASRR